LLTRLARERLEKIQAAESTLSIEKLSLLDAIPILSPHLMRPHWMAPIAELIEKSCEPGGMRNVSAAPPQHGKSQLIEHGFCWLAVRFPGRRHGYVTYSAERAEYVSAEFQRIAERAGLEPEGRLSDVRLKGGTEIRFTSVGGSFTGFTVDGLLVIDDPLKDRAEAESPTIRRKAVEWFTDVARSRRHPKTSILANATRWHPEDLSGELIARGYPYTNLKAIAEGAIGADGRVEGDPLRRFPGESLWTEVKPPAFFLEEREDEYTWQSLYQGEPRGRGKSVFHWPDLADNTRFYDSVPTLPSRICIGADFAYTAKTHADYSVAVVLAQIGGTYYVLDVIRRQVEPRVFRDELRLAHAERGESRVCAYVAATEQGGIEFIKEAGIPVLGLSAAKAGDKFTRALPSAAAWNTGRILLPKSAPWLDAFLQEICGFTGVKDRHDDQVDALAAAFDGLAAENWQSPDWTYLDELAAAAPEPLTW
jgi:predicted phage terminase large subunit-like protein